MVTECQQLVALSSIQTMSAKSATLPLQTFNGIGMGLNPMNSPFKNSLKCDKKVEVRWLETESDLYLKQWQRRHRQLEGIEDTSWSKNYLLDHHDDWYQTARRILDLDVNYLNSKDFDKFNPQNSNHLNFFFNSMEPKFVFDIENGVEDEDYNEFESDTMQFNTIPITIDPSMEFNQELITILKSNNLIIKNGKLEYFSKKTKNTEKEKSEKQTKKTQKLQATMESNSVVNDESASVASSDTSPSKSSNKSPRSKSSTTKQRTRPPSGRRQMYTCEYPGCSYQSDRNFNFLRHKRTHGKQKSDENKKTHNGISMPSEMIYTPAKVPNLNEPSPYVGLETGSTINNDMLHLNSPHLLPTDFSINLPPQCNSLPPTSDRDQAFSLTTDDYLERPNIVIKDINTLDHVLADNHLITNLTIEQPFLS